MREVVKSKNNLLLILIIAASFFLRIWKIDKVPVSLFSDELDVGYQAYSIIKTGKDYLGNSWPLAFQSFADNRTPIYIYSSIPTVALFGISPLGVRLPAVIFGVLDVWMIYLLSNQIIRKKFGAWNLEFGILPALFLAVSPWHLQYSRAAFEVTQMLFFYLLGIYLFFVSLSKGKYLWLSALSFCLTPWIYSTLKLFTPVLILFLVTIWFKDIKRISKKEILKSIIVILILAAPMIYITFFGAGGQRFNYISVFSDPTTYSEADYARLYDAQVRQVMGGSILSKISSRIIHNKYTFWGSKIIDNYYQTFSTEFLFISGDPNLRHSIGGMGQFYKVEMITLLVGSAIFFFSGEDKKNKLLIAFWIIFGVVPSAVTRDGGNHATRLIIILPALIILISYGIFSVTSLLPKKTGKLLLLVYGLILISSFYFYQHNYWVHNPWYSERSWHAGYKEAVQSAKEIEGAYSKIVLTNSNDDPRMFFAAYYPYSPVLWQKGPQKGYVSGFGELPHYDKYYFGQVDGTIGLSGLSEVMDDRTLYVAAQSEIKGNLVMEPDKIPLGLKLVKAITYPSGEPAFYFFAKGE